jgi:hypothetical protein
MVGGTETPARERQRFQRYDPRTARHETGDRGYLIVAAAPDALSGILLGWINGAHRSMATHVASVGLPGPLDKLPRSR